jgi:hypothetical protein
VTSVNSRRNLPFIRVNLFTTFFNGLLHASKIVSGDRARESEQLFTRHSSRSRDGKGARKLEHLSLLVSAHSAQSSEKLLFQ